MSNDLFCHSGMTKKAQLELVYSDFLDMLPWICVRYKPNNCVLAFNKRGYLMEKFDQESMRERILRSFDICRYTFDDGVWQAHKLAKKFMRSLPIFNFKNIKNAIGSG